MIGRINPITGTESRANQRATRLAATILMSAATLASGTSALAASGSAGVRMEPRWEDQVIDAVVARPIGILATGAGAMVWGVSLPFSLLGGNAGEAGDKLVGGPARETFQRCLGCPTAGRRQSVANPR